jgi:elongation factor 3
MEQYFNNLHQLNNKKTKPNEKFSILNSIDLTQKGDEFKIKLCSYLLLATGERNLEVQTKAFDLLSQIVKSVNPYLVKSITRELLDGLTDDKNERQKINTIKLLIQLSNTPFFKECIGQIVEPLSYIFSEMSTELVSCAQDLFKIMIDLIGNKDIQPVTNDLIQGLVDIKHLPQTIDSLTSTVFVQSVDAPTLSVIYPLLFRALKNGSYVVKRQTIVIIENMTKLVEDERSSLHFINNLLPLVQSAQEEISDPGVRMVASKVFKKLTQIKETGEQAQLELTNHLNHIKSFFNNELNLYSEEIIDTLYHTHTMTVENLMNNLHIDNDISTKIFNEINQSNNEDSQENNDGKEELCNISFTLGYGSRVLLHQTKLHLFRGYRYGLIGSNGSGKTTLMRAIATQQLESFPSHLKSVFVETDILGELSHLSLLDYIKADEKLKELNFTDEYILSSLKEMSFTDNMIYGGVSALSGGWRMKLALTRALMQHADILLMDEPTAHLDVINVKWLLDYINSLTNVSCIIVSQNAKLLNDCCSHIMQIKNHKLYTSHGNLNEFLKKNPDANSYFELKTDKYSFKFPQPRFLDGIKSKGKALMKMEHVTFGYDVNRPIIKDGSVQVSLSSRIGCLGPNGAGKSTAIKILTGQLEPQSGSVWTYPGVKIGYIAQHAFAHISNHLEKTPNEYIQWRYGSGEDKEELSKVNMQFTDDDIKALVTEIMVDIDDKKAKKFIKKLTYGRRVGKSEREYEVELENSTSDYNQWLTESDLVKRGYTKMIKIIDSKCDASEGQYKMALTQQNIEDHLEKVGMIRENISHVKIKHLSNGDKVKVVIGAALWMLPHILILDEPTNNIDRDGLAALSEAIKEFEGGIIIITHDEQFCHNVCKEIWVIENQILNIKGDPDWMRGAVGEKIESKEKDSEMVDALGNTIKIKDTKKTLTRKERMAREKRKKMLRELGEPVSSDEE